MMSRFQTLFRLHVKQLHKQVFHLSVLATSGMFPLFSAGEGDKPPCRDMNHVQ